MAVNQTVNRFWDKVKKQEGCWPWLGSQDQKGYGSFKLNGKAERSNRIAYLMVNNSIPEGLHILHTCHNSSCCNPAHLYAGTNAQNQADRVAAGHTPKRKLSESVVRSIREELATGAYLATAALHHNVSKGTVSLIKSGEYNGTTKKD